MADPFANPFADFFKTSQLGAMPGNPQALMHDGLAKTRDAALKSLVAVKNGVETITKNSAVASKETAELATTAFDQVIANTDAAFIATQAIMNAKSPMEAIQLQTNYVQAQLAKSGEQAKLLLQLSTKAAQKSAEDFNGLATKAAGSIKI